MKVLKNVMLATVVLLGQSAFAEPGWQSLGDLIGFQEHGSQVDLTAQRGKVRITALSPTVIRITYGWGGNFPPFDSFAVLSNAFPENPKLRVRNSSDSIELRTEAVTIQIQKSPLRIAFRDSTGKILSEERREDPAAFNGTAFRVWKSMPEDEHYFGLGDKSGPLDHRELA